MRGAFDDEEFEPAGERPDTVLTLGPLMAVGLFLGLALLCGLSFAFGYAVGHRVPQPVAATNNEAADKQKPANADAAKAKPAAQNNSGKGLSNATNRQSAAVAPQAGQSSQTPPKDFAEDSPARDTPARPTSSTPAGGSTAGWMVQIAAVSHREDAEVLEGALRKRGYAVTLNHDAADNLIHVRIGPFSNRDEAAKWRQKLLSDGYNAMLQP
jgi:cell division septation protein DedD